MLAIAAKKEERAALVEAQRRLLEAAEAEGRDLTAEEQEKWERMEADFERLTREIKRLEEFEARAKAVAAEAPTVAAPETATKSESRTATRDAEEYRAAYVKWLRAGAKNVAPDEVRALSVGTASAGGYLVPTEFERQLIQGLTDRNIMRGLATVITTSADRDVPVVSAHGTASWMSEAGAYTESDETFSQVTLSAYKLGTLIKLSEELLMDSAFDLEAYIRAEFARRLGDAEEAAFVNGDGSGKPTGVVGSADAGVTAAANNAITADELIDLYHALGRPYRARATWLMADSTAKAVRKLKDSNGQYLWQPGLQAGQPDRILGRPVAVSDNVPAIGSSAKSVVFGDLSYYWVAQRSGIYIQRLDELYAANGQVGFRAFLRVDGKLILSEACKVLTHPL